MQPRVRHLVFLLSVLLMMLPHPAHARMFGKRRSYVQPQMQAAQNAMNAYDQFVVGEAEKKKKETEQAKKTADEQKKKTDSKPDATPDQKKAAEEKAKAAEEADKAAAKDLKDKTDTKNAQGDTTQSFDDRTPGEGDSTNAGSSESPDGGDGEDGGGEEGGAGGSGGGEGGKPKPKEDSAAQSEAKPEAPKSAENAKNPDSASKPKGDAETLTGDEMARQMKADADAAASKPTESALEEKLEPQKLASERTTTATESSSKPAEQSPPESAPEISESKLTRAETPGSEGAPNTGLSAKDTAAKAEPPKSVFAQLKDGLNAGAKSLSESLLGKQDPNTAQAPKSFSEAMQNLGDNMSKLADTASKVGEKVAGAFKPLTDSTVGKVGQAMAESLAKSYEPKVAAISDIAGKAAYEVEGYGLQKIGNIVDKIAGEPGILRGDLSMSMANAEDATGPGRALAKTGAKDYREADAALAASKILDRAGESVAPDAALKQARAEAQAKLGPNASKQLVDSQARASLMEKLTALNKAEGVKTPEATAKYQMAGMESYREGQAVPKLLDSNYNADMRMAERLQVQDLVHAMGTSKYDLAPSRSSANMKTVPVSTTGSYNNAAPAAKVSAAPTATSSSTSRAPASSTARVSSSTARVSSSTARVSSSTARVSSSTAKVSSSTAKVSSSTPRVSANAPRVSTATSRVYTPATAPRSAPKNSSVFSKLPKR